MIVLLILGLIFLLISLLQASGTQYSGESAPYSFVIGTILVLLYCILK